MKAPVPSHFLGILAILAALGTVGAAPLVDLGSVETDYIRTATNNYKWSDASGNGYDATVANGNYPHVDAGTTPAGRGYLDYVSATAGMSFATGASNPFSTAAFTSAPTFSLLLAADDTATDGKGTLFSGSTNGIRFGLVASSTSGYMQMILAVNGNSSTVVRSSNILLSDYTNDWNVFGMTYDGSTVTFYLNGVSVGTATESITFTAGTSTVGGGSSPATSFIGGIAAFQAYDSVLDASSFQTASNALADTYINAVPEPGSLALLGVGGALAGALALRRRAEVRAA